MEVERLQLQFGLAHHTEAMDYYGEQIRNARCRVRPKVPQEAVARRVGIHPNAMTDIERGSLLISETQFFRLITAVADLVAERRSFQTADKSEVAE